MNTASRSRDKARKLINGTQIHTDKKANSFSADRRIDFQHFHLESAEEKK